MAFCAASREACASPAACLWRTADLHQAEMLEEGSGAEAAPRAVPELLPQRCHFFHEGLQGLVPRLQRVIVHRNGGDQRPARQASQIAPMPHRKASVR